jgi:DNA-binding NarL/FixJ family response regulator
MVNLWILERVEQIFISNYPMMHPPQMMILSPLQREIVKYLATGLNHKEIGNKVDLSRSRIEQILKELRKSFDVPNNISLVNLLSRSHSI